MRSSTRLPKLLLSSLLILASAMIGCAKQEASQPAKVLFVAGKMSHGYNSHEHNAGSVLLAKALSESGLGIEAEVYYNKDNPGWTMDESLLEGLAAVVIYCDGGKKHLANDHVGTIDALTDKGVGVGCLHYGVETVDGEPGDGFLRWMGGYFQLGKSVNPHWLAHFDKLPDHPVTNGVQPFHIQDEWYFNMRFRENMEGVTPILTAVPPIDIIPDKDHHHNATPDARAAVQRRDPQHLMWVSENANGSRGFGFTGGHFHDNWVDDDFRKVVLNAIAWIAHKDIPSDGVPSATPTQEQLLLNQDYPADMSKVRADKYADFRRK
ncbi:MAG: ThuA domain-containing protein [Opitutales bacterium]|nr:ThuA domain-containing protein [Opitutales bacterium]